MALEFTDDSEYFEDNYMKKKMKDGTCHYATHCLECGGEIGGKKSVCIRCNQEMKNFIW